MPVKKIKWSNPELVDLGGAAAYGSCRNGTGEGPLECDLGSGDVVSCVGGLSAAECGAGNDGTSIVGGNFLS